MKRRLTLCYGAGSAGGIGRMHKDKDAVAAKARRAIVARRALMGAAILIAAGQTALAAPTTLVCHNDSRPSDPDMTVDLNEAKGAAAINYPAYYMPNGNLSPVFVPASSAGPFAAKFDARTITFDQKTAVGTTRYTHTRIDRLTGVLFQYNSDGAPWDQAKPQYRVMYHFTCHVGKAKF